MAVDHVAIALSRLPEQFKGKPKIEALVTALVQPVQDAENMLQDLRLLRRIDTATGAQLTTIGSLVGQPRNGLADDDVYRRYIRARIATNRSRGTVNDVIRVARLVLDREAPGIVIKEWGVAAYDIHISDEALTDDLADLLLDFVQAATATSVRVILKYGNQAPANWFIWGESLAGGSDVMIGAID